MNYFRTLWELFALRRNVSKSYEQIQLLQERKLRKLLRHAYEKSVYYHKTFKEAGITIHNIDTLPLSSFPSMDKSLFLEHFDELITVPDLTQEELRCFDEKETVDRKPFKGNYHVIHSSGSTGKPGYFVYDGEAWNNMLLGVIRAAFWKMSAMQILRFLAGNPRVAFIAATDGRYAGAMAVGDGIAGMKAHQLFLDIKTPIAKWIKELREFKPNLMIGYPSAMKILGELVEKGEIRLNVFRVISCGEFLGAHLRNYLEKTFQAEVINIYGASESLSLGVESNDGRGMILFDDMNVIETENDTMYLTSLYNFAQPLIRYRLSDRLTLLKSDAKNSCPFTRAIEFLGRNEDILWFEDANGNREFLHPLAIEGFCMEGLLDYQFCQIEKDAFEMLAETSKTASKESIRQKVLKQMKAILVEKNLDYVQFYVKFVDEILPDPVTGKKRLIAKLFEKERSTE